MIVIKKRVSLEFLGEEYKEGYLIFKSIPAVDFEEVIEKVEASKKDNSKSLTFIVETLKKYFIEGKFPDNNELQEVSGEDLGQFDAATLIECFKSFTGQTIDPKVLTPLTSSSPMEEPSPTNS